MESARSAVAKALQPLLYRAFYAWHIDVAARGAILKIDVVSSEFYTTEKQRQAAAFIEGAREAILRAAGPSFTSLWISVGKETPFCGLISFPIGSADDDGDIDDRNPNWPSKTGNPSGGGRGNNPPRR